MNRPERTRVLLAMGAAFVAGVLIWFAVIRDDGGPSGPAPAVPTSATVADLSAAAASVGHPVYWAGEQPGTQYELTQTEDGRIYVRYLTRGAQIGDPRPNFLTVGTYPVPDSVAALKRAARESGGTIQGGPNGTLVLTDENNPTSVYLGFPNSNYQVEVFDPNGAQASQLVRSGSVVPVP